MSKKLYPVSLVLAMAVAFISGSMMTVLSRTQARGQSDNTGAQKILVHGYGNARSAVTPPGEQFTLIAANAPNLSFKVVPPGKTFILTDMIYNARGVRQDLTVNLVKLKLTPEIAEKPFTGDILLQVYLKPGEGEESHLCTGYVIPSGHSVGAWTNAGLEPGQWVQVAVTGYLVDGPPR